MYFGKSFGPISSSAGKKAFSVSNTTPWLSSETQTPHSHCLPPQKTVVSNYLSTSFQGFNQSRAVECASRAPRPVEPNLPNGHHRRTWTSQGFPLCDRY